MAGQLELSLSKPRIKALGVTQFVRMVREALELHLDQCWIVGEVSNARFAPSDHLYFTLKDSRSALAVVMFRSACQKLRFKLTDGMEVMVRGRVSLYEARGALQFYAEEVQPRGAGALQLAFEQLKTRLSAEGLFDSARKRPLPFMPRVVGLVTALGGAALHDMMTVLLERFPNLHIVIRPARVQGIGAAAEVAEALDDLNRDGRAQVIIVGRGGGSLEDLWAFNEEIVARAIHRSAIPIVSAVGHEVDYTIADFVADARAPTPTAAAHLVVPRKAELKGRLDETSATLAGAVESALSFHRRQLNQLGARVREPRNVLRQFRQRLGEASSALSETVALDFRSRRQRVLGLAARLRTPRTDTRRRELMSLEERLMLANSRAVQAPRERLAALAGRLDSLSPLRVLERGYSVVTDLNSGRAVVDAAAVTIGDELEIRLKSGRLRARTSAREV
ncbi:MAG TPA: exodeoxyribonuclease VII large subunit [Candidatus Binataceae bacterium]|nr:exodeoxyribonuclease VII large subunit [Candidatus Binataceae bacterium]